MDKKNQQKKPAKDTSKKERDTAVTVALIGLIGGCIAAFFGFAGDVVPPLLNSPLGQRLWPPTASPTATPALQTPIILPSLTKTMTAWPEPLPFPSLTALPSDTAIVPPVYECNFISLMPDEGAKIRREQAFKIKFLLVNSGKTVWPENLELTLASNPGQTLDPALKPIKIPRVQPGDSFTIGPLDAKAPKTVGHYVVSFKLDDGLCWPYVAFEVVK